VSPETERKTKYLHVEKKMCEWSRQKGSKNENNNWRPAVIEENFFNLNKKKKKEGKGERKKKKGKRKGRGKSERKFADATGGKEDA